MLQILLIIIIKIGFAYYFTNHDVYRLKLKYYCLDFSKIINKNILSLLAKKHITSSF